MQYAFGMSGNFGVVVSGGPAPGINSVISAITIDAINKGYKVYGFYGGFAAVIKNAPDAICELTFQTVRGITGRGGSILGTSRTNPLCDTASEQIFINSLKQNKIDKLVIIGGDGSANISVALSRKYPEIKVAHVPKTIDNDLPLPNNCDTFGFATAQHVGSKILQTLLEDARTVQRRWFIATTMGRSAGFLALGIGIASGATITLIPEEFENGDATIEEIADIIVSSIATRYNTGRGYGVALLAEGILDKLSKEIEEIASCPKDELGRLQYHHLEIGDLVLPCIKRRCAELGMNIKLRSENIGYELRCADPIGPDIEYTRYLGVAAVKYLLEGLSGIMVTRNNSSMSYIKLEDILDQQGKILSRKIDINSDLYKVARSFMGLVRNRLCSEKSDTSEQTPRVTGNRGRTG